MFLAYLRRRVDLKLLNQPLRFVELLLKIRIIVLRLLCNDLSSFSNFLSGEDVGQKIVILIGVGTDSHSIVLFFQLGNSLPLLL